MSSGIQYVVGIDEVGRGPLAGPLVLGFVHTPLSVYKKIEKTKDSKKLSSKKREEYYKKIKQGLIHSEIKYKTVFMSEKFIDKNGITRSCNEAIIKGLDFFNLKPQNTQILLDGGLHAPDVFLNQKTIVKGDEKISVIAIASIVAKVERDKKMEKLALKYPEYGFEKHKGYGTKDHRRIIKKIGPSSVHRMSFLSRIISV